MGEVPLPPGPRTRDLIHTAAAAVRYLPGFFQRVAREYGDIACIVAGPGRAYLLSSPEYAQDLLVDHEERFEKGRGEQRFTRRLLEQGVLGSEGEFHRRQHDLLYPVLHGDALSPYVDEIAAGAHRVEHSLVAGVAVDAFELLAATTTDVMIEVMFGVRIDEPEGQELAAALAGTIEALDELPLPFLEIAEHLPLPANRRFEEAEEHLDSLLMPLIADARTNGGRGMVTRLVRATHPDGSGMDDDQVNAEALSIFRGHRTAGTALCWMWYLLSRHEEVERAVLAEVDEVLGDREPTAADYPRLELCRRVFDEAMRLFPGAWMLSRRAVADHEIDGYPIPEGSTVITSAYVIQRDPRYHPDPRRFDPDRFLPDRRAAWHRFAYFPFGGGSKRCLGDEFAPFEAVLMLASLGRRWRFRPAPGRPVAPAPKATFKPRDGMWFVLDRR